VVGFDVPVAVCVTFFVVLGPTLPTVPGLVVPRLIVPGLVVPVVVVGRAPVASVLVE